MIEQTSFTSNGTKCSAIFYLPDIVKRPPPVIIMAHGLGAVKEMRLDAYANEFCQIGYACFLFDYRFFGSSEGTPRQVVDIGKQLEDWDNAIKHVSKMEDVDQNRIVLFGSSFSGGHVIELASKHKEVAATISQCPFTDGIASLIGMNLLSMLKLVPSIIGDLVCELFGWNPILVDLGGSPGSKALMPVHDSGQYINLVPQETTFKKQVAARIGLHIIFYSPGRAAKNVTCPMYVSICSQDTVAPAKKTEQLVKSAKNCECVVYPVGHFDVYVGEPFEKACSDYKDFLRRKVPI